MNTLEEYRQDQNRGFVVALGARLIGLDLARKIGREWLRTPYEGGRHDRRIAKLDPT